MSRAAALALIVVGAGTCLLVGVGGFVVALVLRRHQIFPGTLMAASFLCISMIGGAISGTGMTCFIRGSGERAGIFAVGGGIITGVIVFAAGIVMALLIGLAGSPGGIAH